MEKNETIVAALRRIGVSGVKLNANGEAVSTLVQLGNAQRHETLNAQLVSLRPQDNRVVWTFDEAALIELAASTTTRRSSSKYSWKKYIEYNLYDETGTQVARLIEAENGDLSLEIDDEDYAVVMFLDDSGKYAKPRNVYTVTIEGQEVEKPARHQLVESAYKAYLGDESDEDDDSED